MESVRDKRNDNIGLAQGSVEGSIIVDIERDGLGVLEARGKGLGALEGTASCYRIVSDSQCNMGIVDSMEHTDSDLDISLAEDLNSGLGDYRITRN